MSSRISAEEVLLMMSYGLDIILMPTRHKYGTSYEQWLYRNGLLGRLHYLQAQRFVERQRHANGWVYKLTETGRTQARQQRVPHTEWDRKWDGWWRQIIFDLPIGPGHKGTRAALIRWLRQQGFGYLQDSVWISPDPVREISTAVKAFRDDAESFTILECRCAPGFSDATLVRAAWPFERIKQAYQTYEDYAAELHQRLRATPSPGELVAAWRQERRLWAAAATLDPLLPRRLWPAGYRGERACQTRHDLLQTLTTRFAPSLGS